MSNQAYGDGTVCAGAARTSRLLIVVALGFALSLETAVPCGAQTYSVFYSFQCGPKDGANPSSTLIRDPDGNLYGTTVGGGASGYGTVFEISTTGAETILHSFAGPPSDGQDPVYTGLVRDDAGNLYGTTPGGGTTLDYGIVYKLAPDGKETVLHSFPSFRGDGEMPYAGLLRDPDGSLYGTTSEGGNYGYGTVFEISPGGKEFPIFRFLGAQQLDGEQPFGGLVRDSRGYLYGTTYLGGQYGGGIVFRLSLAHHRTVLHAFKGGDDGAGPLAGLVEGTNDDFYGTTTAGGPSDAGTVFQVNAQGNERVLYSFTGVPDGALPYGGVIRDKTGNLYGTTPFGGSDACYDGEMYGCGVIFKVSPTGKETALYTFAGPPDGANPEASLLSDGAGNLYGTTYFGGAYGCGTVFKFTP